MTRDGESDALRDAADELLVQLVVSESSELAFRALYRRYAPRLHRVALRMLASEADADDAMQEVWLRAVPRLNGFGWRAALGTWLTSITVNVARDVLDRRSRWRDETLQEEMFESRAPTFGEPIDLERAIALLPPGCRAAFVLHDVEGYTHEEIAEQLGYTAGTSKSQVFRARRMLRRLLLESEAEENRHATS